MTYNEANKISNYKWREANKERYQEYMREYYREYMLTKNKEYYLKHCEKRKQEKRNKYYVDKEFRRFLNILL